MHSHRLNLLVALLALLLVPLIATAMPARPESVQTNQPDGTEITVRLYGDWWYHHYESGEGYAILQDDDDWWVYADLDPSGRYQSTNLRVGKNDTGETSFLATVGPHLREAPEIRSESFDLFHEKTLPGILEYAAELAPGARVVMNVPVIITQYTDFFASQTSASFNDMMNLNGYNGTGSFNDYFTEISYGGLTITATVWGWYTAPNNRNYYRHGSGTIVEINRARELVRNAIDQAEATGGANWVPFDNDADGNVDVVFIVHQGPGAECGNVNFIWSHHWYLNAAGSNFSVTYDGKLIDRYIIMPEISCSAAHIEIGVFCHEYGHALGLPDLYDIDGSSQGIGNWALMAGGGWGGDGTHPETPTHMCAWSKIEQNWITPTVVPVDQTGVSIAQVETNAQVYKLWTMGMPANEYFLVENRQQTGFDQHLYTSGLAIWHIDENQRKTNNTDNTDETHKLVDLEAADGLGHMDANVNRGDAGDLYPGSTVNRFFNDTTNPDSKDYAGANTYVCVDNVSNSASTMTADFCVEIGTPPDLVIRDCAADVGNEPDLACSGNWVRSLDIWIDNNDDGTIDAPIKGVVNHLYIRAWNIGGPDVNANIKCWYVNPSLGLNFGLGSPGTPIQDAVTFQTQLAVPAIGTINPSPGGIGHRAFFNWLIPNPPPNIDHYCIGCVIESAADPQTSAVPLQENNLGQINFWALALKAGTTPAKAAQPDTHITVFREEINVVNPGQEPAEFLVIVEGLGADFIVEPSSEFQLFLNEGEQETVMFDIIKMNSQHLDQAHVEYQLYRLPEFELVGALVHDLYIDSHGPSEVLEWKVEYFRPQGDNFPRPSPRYELSWYPPPEDQIGAPEMVRYYEIHAARTPDELQDLTDETLVAMTGEDDDLQKDGFQYYFFAMDEEDMYFTMRAVDLADNLGTAAPILTAEIVTASPPEVPTASGLVSTAPNPFNPAITIWFGMERSGLATVAVYDPSGRRVAILTSEVYAAGIHQVVWNGKDELGRTVASGTYVVTMQSAAGTQSRKISLVK